MKRREFQGRSNTSVLKESRLNSVSHLEKNRGKDKQRLLLHVGFPYFFAASEIVLTLFLPAAGNRNNAGTLNNAGTNGYYWSSTVNGTNAYNLNFNSTTVNPANNNNRANGFSVRCVAELNVKRFL